MADRLRVLMGGGAYVVQEVLRTPLPYPIFLPALLQQGSPFSPTETPASLLPEPPTHRKENFLNERQVNTGLCAHREETFMHFYPD